MNLITRMRKQTAVWWGNPVPDGTGSWTFDAAVEISCRWQDEQKMFTDKEGKLSISQAKVYVDRDMAPGGFLWLGSLNMLPSDHTNPRAIGGAQEIRAWSKLPNLKVTEFLRTATL